jgi:hypothetical protein
MTEHLGAGRLIFSVFLAALPFVVVRLFCWKSKEETTLTELLRYQYPPPPPKLPDWMVIVSPGEQWVTPGLAKAWFSEQCTDSCTSFTIVATTGTPGTPAGTIVHVLSKDDPIWDKHFPPEGGKACCKRFRRSMGQHSNIFGSQCAA